ncbi:MAG: phage terminase small subunit P27 family [Pelagibacterium sp.]|uniref:phage terminase small subunit P27 family n=1 Tax=Pelagibacterium sp. TaxID=1967288 RepID=UPI0032EA9789
MRGRKPAVTAADAALSRTPSMPTTLAPEMAREWRDIAKDLVSRRLLTRSSLPALETLVGALWYARQCREALAEHGPVVKSEKGIIRPNPAAAMLAKQNETIARLSYEMGVTAAGRNLPTIREQEGAHNDKDAFSEFDL